ncbi:MAG: hypothetical protein JWN21_202 [Sphingomonas bacterium]|nr:hypothetical protein [Sphingomonas bacterium]
MPYVMAAGMSDQYEIQSSRIAVKKSPNARTRRYAAMLIQHHNKTTAATTRAAMRARLAPPAPMLDPRAAPSLAELNAASPADFDRVYFGQQVPAHQAALDLHSSYAANGDAAPLRATARTAVPVVRKHLTDAQRMMNGMPGHNMSRM